MKTVLYQCIQTLLKHVFLLCFPTELLMILIKDYKKRETYLGFSHVRVRDLTPIPQLAVHSVKFADHALHPPSMAAGIGWSTHLPFRHH